MIKPGKNCEKLAVIDARLQEDREGAARLDDHRDEGRPSAGIALLDPPGKDARPRTAGRASLPDGKRRRLLQRRWT